MDAETGDPGSPDVARVRAIADAEERMAAAHEGIRRRLREITALTDLRQEAALELRSADPRRWTYVRIAERLGTKGANLKQDGQQIVRGRLRRDRGR